MLKLKKIKKDYGMTESVVKALKGIDIQFRRNEFVSILGPSGCGKTTLLNIIGGLDRYTSGDLIINGKSTKDFKDREWDSYRNHSVGFIFQSYNLISHQSILSNVELALTLSGVSKTERKKKAIKALNDVGLKDQINKRPNQLSGGQMQRVAIARALVNDPDIILADEPTGALDTKTSIQIMDILKKISKNKLIIMVTHNPDLAKEYSTRIVKILDGIITDDSNPFEERDNDIKKTTKTKKEKTTMDMFTAMHLSLNNLVTKKGRTILTSFAGSIGIIGIALILSLSNGVQTYIDKVQEDALSAYPITIQESSVDMSSMMEVMMGQNNVDTSNYENEKIYSADIMNDMISTISSKVETNNLTELRKYLIETDNKIANNANAIDYMYNLNINLYKADTTDDIVKVNPNTVMESLGMAKSVGDTSNALTSSMFMGMTTTEVWTELLDNEALLQSQYNLVAGNWPKEYNEVVLIVDKYNQISDYTLYALGLKDQEELKEMMNKILKGEQIEAPKQTSYSYDDLLNLSFKLILNSDYYKEENGLWIDKSNDKEFLKEKIKNAENIKICGIIKQNEESVTTQTTGIIGYTKQLEEYVINKSNESNIVKQQKEKPEINIFTKLNFPKENEKTLFDYNNLTDEQKKEMANLSSEELAKIMETYTKNQSTTYEDNLIKLGAINLESPSAINIYPKDFESKQLITDAIEEYNQKQRDIEKEENVINYTDVVGIMMKSVTQIVNTISYVLIAFVAVSLIVSSIMIGIITYISVLERTKEIGILRAMGASKKDISRVFNAETFIIGLVAGILGIIITIVLNIPINMLVKNLTGVTVNVSLPTIAGIILILISMFLTIIAGLIPSKIAAKKDPVEALRIE